MADDAGHDEPVVVYSLRVELQPGGGYTVVERAGSGVCAAGDYTVEAALERLAKWAELTTDDGATIRAEILAAAEQAELAEHEARLRRGYP